MKPSPSQFEKVHKLATKKKFSILIGIVVFFSFCWNIPRILTFKTLTTGEGKDVQVTVKETSLGQDALFGKVYLTIGHSIVQFFIPIVILMVLNTRIVLQVHNPSKLHSFLKPGTLGTLCRICSIFFSIFFCLNVG